MGFAIPSDTVTAIYAEICETGADQVTRASIGVRLQFRAFRGDERQRWGQGGGAELIDRPLETSPAFVAGLRSRDVIVRFNKAVVNEPGAMVRLLDRSCINRVCEVEFVRDDQLHRAEVTPTLRQEEEQANG